MDTSIAKLAPALVKAQATMAAAVKNSKNPHLKNNYADFGAVWDAIQPSLAPNGLAVIQPVKESGDNVSVETILIHESGETLHMGTVPVKVVAAPGINLAQSTGLAITYAKRYGLTAAFCIVTEDDDGNQGHDPRAQQSRQPAPRPATTTATRTDSR